MKPRSKARLRKVLTRLGVQRDWYLITIGAAIGSVTAFGAIGFVELFHMIEAGAMSLLDVWPWWSLPLLPAAGGLLCGLVVHYFARESRGHGVPEVMDALYQKGGRIRRRAAITKGVTSALTIGSGGSAGAEGPIVQIGAAIGSWGAGILRVGRDHTGTLVGCGAAAGIASVFNAPIAGVFFVLEILLRDFSLRTFTPIVIASVFSATVTQAVLGANQAIFDVSGLRGYVFSFPELPSYALLGLVSGLVAVLFIRMLYASEDLAAKVRMHPSLKPMTGGFLLGLLGLAFILAGRAIDIEQTTPPFFGNGYPAIVHLLEPANYGPVGGAPVSNEAVALPDSAVSDLDIPTELWVLTLLLACKLIATCLTLGSGGSGGVFAPSLFLGAATGAAVGVALEWIGLLPADGSPAAYALVGMAAVVAGTTHAPLTAFLIVFEITRDPYVLLPIMLAAVISTVTAQLIMRDSIYTHKLRRRGVLIGAAADLTILRRILARQVPTMPHVSVHLRDPISRLLELNRTYQVMDFVVVDDDDHFVGMITAQDLRTALLEQEAIPLLLVEDLARTNLPTIEPDETLDRVLDKFSRHDVSSLPLAGERTSGDDDKGVKVQGLISRARLMQRYQQALQES